jgi:hypothetical protein
MMDWLLKNYQNVIANPFLGRCCIRRGGGNLITLEIPSPSLRKAPTKSRNDEETRHCEPLGRASGAVKVRQSRHFEILSTF